MDIDSVLIIKKLAQNPYKEGTEPWQVYIDACLCEKNGEVSVKDMMIYNDLPYSYYKKFIPRLIDDNILFLK
jgi:hypothetical protein